MKEKGHLTISTHIPADLSDSDQSTFEFWITSCATMDPLSLRVHDTCADSSTHAASSVWLRSRTKQSGSVGARGLEKKEKKLVRPIYKKQTFCPTSTPSQPPPTFRHLPGKISIFFLIMPVRTCSPRLQQQTSFLSKAKSNAGRVRRTSPVHTEYGEGWSSGPRKQKKKNISCRVSVMVWSGENLSGGASSHSHR